MRIAIAAAALLALSSGPALSQETRSQRWDFEDAEPEKLPAKWTAAKTGEGEGSVWKAQHDETAPSGARVLAQIAAGPRPLFNLCVADGTSFEDLELSVAFKAIKGEIDQGGGVVWRYVDPNNYYIARFNPLEENYRLYRVVEGKREQLATKEQLSAPAGKWHTLTVKMKGNAIECFLNGTKHLEAKDDTFKKAGQIGLWTKADAQTYFDRLEVQSLN
jgi:hypothetical protein